MKERGRKSSITTKNRQTHPLMKLYNAFRCVLLGYRNRSSIVSVIRSHDSGGLFVDSLVVDRVQRVSDARIYPRQSRDSWNVCPSS